MSDGPNHVLVPGKVIPSHIDGLAVQCKSCPDGEDEVCHNTGNGSFSRGSNEQEGKKGVSSVRLKEAEKKEMEKKKQFRSRSLWFFFFRRAQRKKPSSLLDNSGDGPQGIHAHPCPWPDNQ